MNNLEQKPTISITEFEKMYEDLSEKTSAPEEEVVEFLNGFDYLEDNNIDLVEKMGKTKALEIISFLKKLSSLYGDVLNSKLDRLYKGLTKTTESLDD
jgi:hypothetical protein